MGGPRGGRGEETTADQVNIPGRKRKCGGKRVLNCMTINAQSLVNKMSELKTLLKIRTNMKKRPDIISISESWGRDDISDSIFSLDGFTMYRDDKKSSVGGGALLYINDKIEQRVCRVLTSMHF